MGLFSSKKTENTTVNETAVTNFDQRVGADGGSIALGTGAALDASDHSVFVDESDNSFRLQATDNSDNRTFTHIEQLSDDVARDALTAARTLGTGAFALVQDGLAAQLDAMRENRLLAEHASGIVADTTRDNLQSTLNLLEKGQSGVLDLAEKIAASGQAESAAARAGANETIKEVLGFKESSDTKIAQDLIKWGGIVLGLLALVFLFRPRRAS